MGIDFAQINLTQIILAVIALIVALLTRYAIPYAKEKMSVDQMDRLRIAVKTGVYAAEQHYNSNQGQAKKRYVLELLKQQGFIIDVEQVEETMNAMIEAMVKELKIEQGKLPEPAPEA